MHGDLRWSLGPSRGISLAMETKPMRDEMKPEGHTCDQEMHDMMGMPLTSWHGHRVEGILECNQMPYPMG